ncbi:MULTISPECIES: hypothetical protein [unclassified Caballeronia]|uniref:hypothetical protein n=1 Tax=unclassified Caballeronia TaxID=2646786 RepID=UPI002864802B|nr:MULTISPECIES: hypothetical protein [unclassified Caballeronia]MDR5812525.1 hypothetical protein [Caballeronia sp. LZ033]MDR5819377.1 hypothetical protein [Caballeronia sp. LZ043]
MSQKNAMRASGSRLRWLAAALVLLGADARSADDAAQAHYYIGRQGDAFEYARMSAGEGAAERRVLVWYLGNRTGRTPSVRYQDGASGGTLTCYDDCQFVRGVTTVAGKVVHVGRIRVTNDPLIYAIMHDALAGHLSKR